MAFDAQRGRSVLFGGTLGGEINDTWEWDGGTASWTQVLPATMPQVRAVHSMVYDSANGRCVMFGGTSSSILLGDTWQWNGVDWSQAATASPGARCGPAMAYDSARNKTILFGGQGSGPVLNDTWEWDGSNWIQVSSSGPAPRYFHALAYDSQRGRTVLFGGRDGGNYYSDTWEWDGATWTNTNTPGPSARGYHAMVYDSQRERTVLFGGRDGGNLSDTWEWDGLTWTQIVTSGPTARGYHAMSYDAQRGRTVLFGGYDGSILGDTWEFLGAPTGPTAPATYSQVTTTSAPPAVTGHAVAPLPAGGQLLFGGSTGTTFPVLTYELQGSVWTKQFSLLNPMVRANHSLMLDPARQNNLLFGGRNPLGTALNDTWTWANGSWTYLPLANAPSARSEHRMTFDRAANVGLLFGGKNSTGAPLGDFWSWNGTAWTLRNPSSLPPARFAHGLAYDAFRNRTVLFGGSDGNGLRSDIWEWNGVAWTQITPAGGAGGPWNPGPRQSFGMAYDPRSERVIVHGGDANGCLADLWSWDGQAWMLHIPTSSAPTARSGEQLLHDPTTNELLLFAGGCGTSLTDEVWNINLPVFWRWSTFGAGCVGTRGIPSLSVVPGSTGVLGQTLHLQLGNVPAFFSTSFGVLGFNRTTFLGQPLPYSLAPFGLTGCQTWTSSDSSYPMSLPNPLGFASWDLPLPNVPYLLGFELNLQALSFEVPGYFRWASVSNGVIVRLGDR
ncbi:MAG: hypothetical protein IT456_06755 [Planctomycetes bacterium]|nr:hypothetical protein [Planctomycetota bacterium]